MPKRKKKKYSHLIDPMLGVIGVGVTSQIVGASGATGAARSVLNIVPTVQAAGVLKKTAKKNKWF